MVKTKVNKNRQLTDEEAQRIKDVQYWQRMEVIAADRSREIRRQSNAKIVAVSVTQGYMNQPAYFARPRINAGKIQQQLAMGFYARQAAEKFAKEEAKRNGHAATVKEVNE